MCGIVGAVSTRNIVPVLVQGLQRLEYRGYDSCGVAVHIDGLQRARSTSRVAELIEQVSNSKLQGGTGIAHTRWATHGAPAVHNAHPHFSHGTGADAYDRPGRIALVHNGIIENHDELRASLSAKGYVFQSQTDTEVIAHLVDSVYDGDLFEAVQAAARQLHGSFAIAVLHRDEPQRLVGARQGSPLVLGVGADGKEHFLASDAMALAGVTDQIAYLEDGDVVDVQLGKHWIVGAGGQRVQRAVKTVQVASGAAELGPYRHYMQKEIFEQPRAVADTLEGVLSVAPELFEAAGNHAPGEGAHATFGAVDQVLILACGTSYYAGCVAKYWLEAVARIPTQVEIASEYRYRASVANPRTLVVTISQSGETADTLAALRHAQELGMRHTLTVCNVPTSAMVRECRLAYLTRAGTEIGVASTKAFTTQLVGLFLLTLALAQARELLPEAAEANFINQLRHLRFLRNGEQLAAHMARHAAIIRPRFESVLQTLERELADTGMGTWTRPRGGYFISFDTLPGLAREVVRLADAIGVKLTPAGATFPYGEDPEDRNIRLSPTFPPTAAVQATVDAFVVCVQLASVRQRLG